MSFRHSDALKFKENKLNIYLKDPLEHPYYSWPQTLINYEIEFEDGLKEPKSVKLVDFETNKAIPFQLSNLVVEFGEIRRAKLSFIADLPSGCSREYQLKKEKNAAVLLEGNNHVVTCIKEEDTIVIDNGKLKFRIPAKILKNKVIPGPIIQIKHRDRWFGLSYLDSPKISIIDFKCEQIEQGPLFVIYKLTYVFEENKQYIVKIKSILHVDYIELDEEMIGIEKSDEIYLVNSWDGFTPTHRYTPNRVIAHEKKVFEYEKIDRQMTNIHIAMKAHKADDGMLPFSLIPFGTWPTFFKENIVTFWDANNDESMGIFVRRPEKWQDYEYAIWESKETLAVKFFYDKGILSWKWPVIKGTRATALCVYPHNKDIAELERIKGLSNSKLACRFGPTSYTLWLQIWYDILSLDKVKDWLLSYSDDLTKPTQVFPDGQIKSVKELEEQIFANEMVVSLPLYGTRENQGMGPVPARAFYHWWIDGYHRLAHCMSKKQKKRLTAMYLLMAYVHAGEDVMPLRTMLGGHPNFLADVKSVPALIAFLFPKHPKAKEWVELFDKYLELNTRYNTRPAVKSWNAKGGRWTENINCYVWAFLFPSFITAFVLKHHFDGRNHLLTPQLKNIGRWLVDSLTSPIQINASLHRGLLPQGAHASQRIPPRLMWYFGQELRRYAPLIGEYLMWGSNPDNNDLPSQSIACWESVFKQYKKNNGTNPHLQSCKYTGYGITLRAAVDTPEETFVHLQQLDNGPNYRWGFSGQGGCGTLYYYAAGKAYSHNGREDVGDRLLQDTDLCTNFGVFKQGAYRSIGQNELFGALYSLETIQYGEILAKTGKNAYSWPEHLGRSIMLVGSDYLVTYDAVFSHQICRRFSWFVHKEEDFPHIYPVLDRGIHGQAGGSEQTEIFSKESKGIWFDGSGDFMAVVTHKNTVKPETTDYGCKVLTENGVDYIFQRQHDLEVVEEGMRFTGTIGLIREKQEEIELALIKGDQIEKNGLKISCAGEAGLIIRFSKEGITGKCSAKKAAIIHLSIEPNQIEKTPYNFSNKTVFIDSVGITIKKHNNYHLEFEVPAGNHKIEIADGSPIPAVPEIIKTVVSNSKIKVFWNECAGATRYLIELSQNDGVNWMRAGETGDKNYQLNGLKNGTKLHVRVTALNEEKRSSASLEYPVYVTDEVPPCPEGLKVQLCKSDKVSLKWGQVLGVDGYCLYRREKGQLEYEKVYVCEENFYSDHIVGSLLDQISFEYAVSCFNGNGEGRISPPVDMEAKSWQNWDPKPGEPFRRTYDLKGIMEFESTLFEKPIYYPD